MPSTHKGLCLISKQIWFWMVTRRVNERKEERAGGTYTCCKATTAKTLSRISVRSGRETDNRDPEIIFVTLGRDVTCHQPPKATMARCPIKCRGLLGTWWRHFPALLVQKFVTKVTLEVFLLRKRRQKTHGDSRRYGHCHLHI